MKRSTVRKLLISTIVLTSVVGYAFTSHESYSASLTDVSVTLSNSRLSFSGALESGNVAGTSQVIIETNPGDYPSTNSAQLVEGDVLRIGEGGSMASYTVTDVINASTVNVGTVLASGDADEDDVVISSQSAQLTVRFDTANAIEGGRFRVLVPALTDNTNAADGLPDQGFFDFGSSAPSVTCPSDIANYDFVAGTASASAVTINGTDYHSYECAYSGTGGVGTQFDGTTNDAIVIDDVINPAPKANHATGTADTYNIIVQHLNNSFTVADTTTVNVGVIEAVRVTASVPPQISFRIFGVGSGVSACGNNTSVATTAASVPFGELVLNTFRYAAQGMSVSTNAASGYAVTAVENDQLGRDGGTCTGDPTLSSNTDCIEDSRGDNTAMTHANEDEWSTSTINGFAYSLDDLNTSGLTPSFEYDSSTNDCDGSGDCHRQFADAENSQSPEEIFSASNPADNHNLYVCYKISAGSTQAAGNYENYVTYTATATF